ncbi:MAG: hypothetical protein RBG13Loki_4248, partial [Promethearchaeota archaeon CR_4]
MSTATNPLPIYERSIPTGTRELTVVQALNEAL